jgi:uncharacterized protein
LSEEFAMPVDHIRYDLLTQDALRDVILRVLADAAIKGLPGEHHFFITFDTRAEGVRMSTRLRSSYPEDMTIVLQHQFWDLAVGDDHFEVGLAFNGIPEKLHIPLKAVKGFFDPSVQFGLQFTVEAEPIAGTSNNSADAAGEPGAIGAAAAATAESNSPADTAEAAKEGKGTKGTKPAVALQGIKTLDESAPKDDGDGQVVRLDRFRKK